MQKIEHDLFRGAEMLTFQLLEWISQNETEMTAVGEMTNSVCELLKDLASEEMEDFLTSLLDDIGALFVLVSKHPALKQLLENKLVPQFDAIQQPRPKLLLYRSLVIVNKKTPCL